MRIYPILIATILLASVSGSEAVRSHPIANFTMNFLKGLDFGKVSFDYIPCTRAINSTLLKVLDIVSDYKQKGVDGLLDSVTFIISQIFDLNSTCQVAAREVSLFVHEFMMEFKDENYLLAVLAQFMGKIEQWIEQTVRFKSCFYWGWYGCAGLSAGRFVLIVLNATPKHKTTLWDELIRFPIDEGKSADPFKLPTTKGELVRLIFNVTLNFLDTAGLLSSRNATKACKDHTEHFYGTFLQVLDMIIDEGNWKDGMYLLLQGLKAANTMYRTCKKTLHEFVDNGSVYISTLINPKMLINNMIFRSKPLMSRGVVTVEAYKSELYEELGMHLGYLINILLWQ